MAHLAFIDIDDIADILEGEEGDAYGQEDDGGVEACCGGELVGPAGEEVDHLHVGVGDGVVDVGEEVGVFEIEEYGEVDDDAEGHECFASFLLSVGGHAVEGNAERPSEECGEDEQQDEESRGLVVEE